MPERKAAGKPIVFGGGLEGGMRGGGFGDVRRKYFAL